jgi:hypothetical protein
MRTQTVREIDDRSRAAGGRIIFSVAVAAAGLSLIIGTWNIYTTERVSLLVAGIFSMMFAGGCMAAIINIIIFFRVGRLDDWYDDEPPYVPPPQDVSELLDLRTEHRPGQVSLHYAEDAHIRISHMKLTKRQWRTLAERMSAYALTRKRNYWTWRRKDLEGLVTSITAPGVYKQLTRDMEKIGVVKNGRVTTGGRDAICEAAGFEVVI